jgi:hypothetical protein
LIGLLLNAGLVALSYGFVWISLLSMQSRGVPPVGPRSRSRIGGWWRALPALAALALLVPETVSKPGVAVSGVLVPLLFCLPGVATVFIVSRRAAETGTFPPARSAPLGMFWISVFISIISVAVAVGSLTATITMGHSC